jgi:DNA-binding protein H-NS
MNKKLNLDSMSIDEMWDLHQRIIQVLSAKLTTEKQELEKRLAKLSQDKDMPRVLLPDQEPKERRQKRRKYPKVAPRYRNPDDPAETWSGRGKQPRWLASALTKGRAMDEFRIADAEPVTAPRAAGGTSSPAGTQQPSFDEDGMSVP